MPFNVPSPNAVLGRFTAERLSGALVYASGALVGAYAAPDFTMTPAQWAGAALALSSSVLVAVLVRVWPKETGTAE